MLMTLQNLYYPGICVKHNPYPKAILSKQAVIVKYYYQQKEIRKALKNLLFWRLQIVKYQMD